MNTNIRLLYERIGKCTVKKRVRKGLLFAMVQKATPPKRRNRRRRKSRGRIDYLSFTPINIQVFTLL